MTNFFLALFIFICILFFFLKKNNKNSTKYKPIEVERHKDPNESKDAWEGSFWEAENPRQIEALLAFNYIDGNNEKTHRKVRLKQFDNKLFGGMFIGHCLLRNATRTFRYDRISDAIDLESGEIISDISHWLSSKYELSPEFSRDNLLENDYDILRILLFIGKADGQFRKDERSIVASTCRLISDNSEITDEMVQEMFDNLEVPSYRAFQLAVGRVSKKQNSIKSIVLDAVEKMIATQKNVNVIEEEAVKYIKSKFETAL